MDLSKLSDADLLALKAGDLSKVSTEGLLALKGQGDQRPDVPWLQKNMQDLAGGAIRGAGSIGATILAPYDIAKDAMAGKGLSLQANKQRRADMDSALSMLGFDPNSLAYGAGKIGGEIAGTVGVPVLGAGGNLATRVLGGAASGGLAAGLVDPSNAAAGAAVGGGIPLLGAAVSPLLRSGSRSLMQSAIKPTIKQLKTGDAETAVDTLLQYGISPNTRGVEKIRDLIGTKNEQIKQAIGSSTAQINKSTAARPLLETMGDFSKQVNPTADLNAITGVGRDFLNHPVYPGLQMPVQAAQDLKQGTYKILAKKYGQVGTAETEAQKAIARGLKDEIASAVPAVKGLNAEETRLLKTLDVAERRALMELNKNPMGLSLLSGSGAAWAAFMADRSAAFKALAARLLHRTNQAGAVAPYIGRAGVLAAEE